MNMFTGEVVAVLKSLSETQINQMFDSLAEQKRLQILSTDDEDLSKLKAKVSEIETIRQTFLRERAR